MGDEFADLKKHLVGACATSALPLFDMSLQIEATIATFAGTLLKISHESSAVKGKMKFNLFLPAQTSAGKVPVLYYLAGLTCTGDNGAEKGNFFAPAHREGIAIVFPDTSPRGAGIAGEDDNWDFGTGAGFYLNATRAPWSEHYRMEDYVVNELPSLLAENFGDVLDGSRQSIFGHSMGGLGALNLFLRHPNRYKSVSAFAPIANPTKCPWGEKAFSGYLASKSEWADHDPTELLKTYVGPASSLILIDVGRGDQFYQQKQLLPENFSDASLKSPLVNKVDLRVHDKYDHSYYFIATFADDHITHHAKYLKA